MFSFFVLLVRNQESHHEIVQKYGSTWLKVFYHDSTGENYFNNKDQGKYSFDVKKYSILSDINASFLINGLYEFLLEYPETPGYNRWRQKFDPLHSQENGVVAEGYDPIHISWTAYNWGGMFLHQNDRTLVDGCYDGYWWYSLGTINNHYKPGFPGPGFAVTKCYMWVRIDGSSFQYYLPTKNNKKQFSSCMLLIVFLSR